MSDGPSTSDVLSVENSEPRSPKWDAALLTADLDFRNAPAEVGDICTRFNQELCDAGDRLGVAPRRMATMLATVIAGMAMVETEGNPFDTPRFNSFIEHCHASVVVCVARARLASGWSRHGAV